MDGRFRLTISARSSTASCPGSSTGAIPVATSSIDSGSPVTMIKMGGREAGAARR
jgi:hypothetical protein